MNSLYRLGKLLSDLIKLFGVKGVFRHGRSDLFYQLGNALGAELFLCKCQVVVVVKPIGNGGKTQRTGRAFDTDTDTRI